MIVKTKHENAYIDEKGKVYYTRNNQYCEYCQWKDNVGYLQFIFARKGKGNMSEYIDWLQKLFG